VLSVGKLKPVMVGGGEAVVQCTITAKRQLTIPKQLMEIAGLEAGAVVLSATEGSGEVTIRRRE